MYSCIPCKFKTNDKSKYSAHIVTNKHIKKLIIVCIHCDDKFISNEDLDEHQNECISYYKFLVNKKDNELIECKNKIVELENENNSIKNSLNQNENKLVGMNIKVSNNMKYIFNYFKNAPNFSIPIIDLTNNELMTYVDMGQVEGAYKLFIKLFPSDITPTQRSFWNLDSNRAKFLTKFDDKWNIDIDGQYIYDKFVDRIKLTVLDKCHKMTTERKQTDEDDDDDNYIINFEKEDKMIGKMCAFAYELSNIQKNKKRVMKQIGPIYSLQLVQN